MAQNPKHYGSFTFLDYSNEKSSMEFMFEAITALSLPTFLDEFGDLRAATQAISLGSLVQDQWVGDQTVYNAAAPSNLDAQRERKFLVIYQDSVTFARYRLEIPCAEINVSGRLVAGTDQVNLANTEIATWITAFEALCTTPDGNNNPNVLEMRVVGRAI